MLNHKVVVIGDIGGQRHIFEEVLSNLGVDSNYRIPAGISIIQVGDVSRAVTPDSPLDSLGCVEIADKLMRVNGERYTQLLGNHEFSYLSFAKYPSHWYLIPQAQEIIRSWWSNRRVALAATITTDSGTELLVTHAGLTLPYWKRIGSPLSVRDTMLKLNSYVGRGSNIWSEPGCLVTGEINTGADCVWAEAACELLHPWVLHDGVIPFQQVYGHSLTVNWEGRFIWDKTSEIVRQRLFVDYDARLTHTTVGKLSNGEDATFYSVDWALGNELSKQVYELRTWNNAVVNATIPAF